MRKPGGITGAFGADIFLIYFPDFCFCNTIPFLILVSAKPPNNVNKG